jgi:glycosyltransferase 2 family protein
MTERVAHGDVSRQGIVAISPARRSRKRLLGTILLLLGISVAVYLIYRGLSRYHLDEIVRSVRAVPWSNLGWAVLFTIGSYLCLSVFEWLGIRYTGGRVAYRRVLLASFVSLSLAHSIGLSGLSSGALRYRFYTRWGLSGGDVAKLVLFSGVTVGLGLMVLGGAALLLQPQPLADLGHIGAVPLRAAGVFLLALAFGYLALAFVIRGKLSIRRWTLEMPPAWIAAAQLAIGTLNFLFVSAALHALVSSVSDATFLRVATAYVSGNVLTLMIHVPGGLGVIEAATLYLVPSRQNLIGPLLVFRLVYYIGPLMIGLVTLAVTELIFRDRKRRAGPYS